MTTSAIFNNNFFKIKQWWMPVKLYRVICDRANARTEEYMLKLLAERYPEAKLYDLDSLPSGVEHLILLYPDAIGLGWGATEKICVKKVARISVLNGRKREFRLGYKSRLNLKIKRILEIIFIPEIMLAPVLLVLGASLAIKDKLLGYSK